MEEAYQEGAAAPQTRVPRGVLPRGETETEEEAVATPPALSVPPLPPVLSRRAGRAAAAAAATVAATMIRGVGPRNLTI